MKSISLEISDTGVEALKSQLGCTTSTISTDGDLFIGKKWFIRTVTYHLIGKVEKRVDGFLILSGASWVADSGRFMQTLQTGTLNEVEPVGEAIVNESTIVDAFLWHHDLPTKQK